MRLGRLLRAGSVMTTAALLLAGTSAFGAFQRSKISPSPSGAIGDEFGTSVGMSGTIAIVGAPQTDAANGGLAPGKGVAYTYSRTGSTWTQQAKLAPGDLALGDGFGWSVAVAGDIAVVGAYKDDDKGIDSGSAYIFTRLGSIWSQQAKIVPADLAAGDLFGYSVAISATTVVIGARDKDASATKLNIGSAYVYQRSGTSWVQQAKLVADDAGAKDAFGHAVAVAGDTAIIGAPGDNIDPTPASDKGSAYVFTRSGTSWSQQVKLTADDGTADDVFGSAVAISGETVLVGAKNDDRDATNTNSGSAYAFTRTGTTWAQQGGKLRAADGTKDDQFGYSLTLVGDTAVIGAPGDQVVDLNSGSAYVFTRLNGAWSQEGKFTPRPVDQAKGDKFGTAVALTADIALVGAAFDDDGGLTNRGAVFSFEFIGCSSVEEAVLAALDAATARMLAEILCPLHLMPV